MALHWRWSADLFILIGDDLLGLGRVEAKCTFDVFEYFHFIL